MAILAFQKPEKVITIEATNTYGKFAIHPLEPRYGITVGNALRRILLASLEGFAITSIRIDGVKHEFATIPGVLEDVTNIILALKEVRFRRTSEEATSEKVSISVSGTEKQVFTAGDISEKLTSFEVLNPELLICHLDESANFTIELTIKKGRGYVPADENREANEVIDTIAIDSIFTPIRNVKYAVENFRVEQKTDYENLILEITTDGSISPHEALKEASKILVYHFTLFTNDGNFFMEDRKKKEEEADIDDDDIHMRQTLKMKLTDMNLSVRAVNCLSLAGINTVGELVQISRNDLLKFRNFGKKSLTEIDELLDALKLSFDMDISKYKLDLDKE